MDNKTNEENNLNTNKINQTPTDDNIEKLDDTPEELEPTPEAPEDIPEPLTQDSTPQEENVLWQRGAIPNTAMRGAQAISNFRNRNNTPEEPNNDINTNQNTNPNESEENNSQNPNGEIPKEETNPEEQEDTLNTNPNKHNRFNNPNLNKQTMNQDDDEPSPSSPRSNNTDINKKIDNDNNDEEKSPDEEQNKNPLDNKKDNNNTESNESNDNSLNLRSRLGSALGINKNKNNNETESGKSTESSSSSGGLPLPGKLGGALNTARGISDTANDIKENGVVDTAKNVAETEIKQTVKRTIINFIISNPIVIVIILVVIVAIFIILLVVMAAGGTSDDDSSTSGTVSVCYDYVETSNNVCEDVIIIDENNNSTTISFEEYVARVVNAEVGSFHNDETYKAAAVMARSFAQYALNNRDSGNCTIRVSKGSNYIAQAYSTKTPGDEIEDAVEATKGLVLTDTDGSVYQTMYSAWYYEKKDENYYYILPGDYNTQEPLKVTVDWATTHVSGYLNNPGASANMGDSAKGASQYGMLYLAEEEGYDWEQILHYFYGDDKTLSYLYTNSSNCTETGETLGTSLVSLTDVTTTGATDQIKKPLSKALSDKGTTVDEFNTHIMNNIVEAGVGTRDGAVAAALALVWDLFNKGIRLPYTYSGQHGGTVGTSGYTVNNPAGSSFYGIDPNWGSFINKYVYKTNTDTFGPYNYYGPDCSGFVIWVLHNAGFDISSSDSSSGNLLALGTEHQANDTSSFIAQPGDLLGRPGHHVTLIVGVSEDKKHYYTAEASNGTNGVIIQERTISDLGSEYVVTDMTSWYASHATYTSANVEEYKEAFQNGTLD